MLWKVKVKLLSPVQLFETPWIVAYHSPLSMGFSRQEYWSGVPLSSPMDLYKSSLMTLEMGSGHFSREFQGLWDPDPGCGRSSLSLAPPGSLISLQERPQPQEGLSRWSWKQKVWDRHLDHPDLGIILSLCLVLGDSASPCQLGSWEAPAALDPEDQ